VFSEELRRRGARVRDVHGLLAVVQRVANAAQRRPQEPPDDVRVLIQVLDRLVDAGHSVVIIEHHLDVIKRADWIVDLGPEAGEGGGRVVAQGTPEEVAQVEASHTGRYLREVLAVPASTGVTGSSGRSSEAGRIR